MKKISRILTIIIAVITITCLMAIAASAAISCSSYYVFMNETENYKVGQIANIPASRYTADLASSDYGVQNTYTYSFSDSSMVKVSGEKVTFVKEGTLTLTIKHNQKFERTGKTSSHTDTIKINVSTEPIQTTNIKLDSGAFSGGKEFPAFTVVNDENCYVEEATFYKEMADYYVGDKLPSYSAGTTINYVSITLKPKAGYFFGWGGTNDGKKHESNVYTVEYKGKKYVPNVVHDQINNEMHVYVDVTFEEGEIYATTFKDLDAPYHCGPLDKTVTTNSDVELVSVKYTMFNKELAEVKKGDTVGITVRVKSKDPKNTFNANGYAYWMEQKINSVNTKLISSTEAEYTFTYNVDALDSQTIKWADFTMPGVYADEALLTNAFSATDGVVIKSVTWTPNDAKADATKEYTVKIEFDKKDEFVYADDFEEQGVVSINGTRAKFIADVTYKGKFKTAKYYAEATYKPTVVVNTGTTTGTMTETGTDNNYVTGTIVPGTTAPEFIINLDYNIEEYTAEQGEKVILDFTHDMDLMLCSNIHYQWYKATGNIYGTGEMVEGGDKKQLQAHTYEVGTDYYYCIMTCEFDGSKYTSDHSDSPLVKVTVTESTAKDFFIYPVGKVDVTVTKPSEFSLKVAAEGYGKQDVLYTWFACDKDGKVDFSNDSYNVLSNTDTLTVSGIPLDKANIPHYYKCIGNIYGGESEVIFTVTLDPEEIPEEEIPEEKFDLAADGEQDVIIYSWEESVTLKAKVTGTDKYADFQWFECDKDGNTITTTGTPLSMGESVTVGPIPQDKMMVPQYYRCTAMVGNTAKSLVFSVILAPMGVEEEYVFPFTDVSEKSWYYESVLSAHRDGLINGKTETKFMPDDNMTVAEAIKLAVCMNILFDGGDPNTDIKVGTPVWYSTYMDYAVKHGIIEEDLSARANQAISRAEYVTIFCAAIPAKNLAAKNTIPAGSIPDVEEDKSDVGNAIYTFYRAGIIAGIDKAGTFNFYANIKRAEVAAVLARITSPSLRVGAPENLGK